MNLIRWNKIVAITLLIIIIIGALGILASVLFTEQEFTWPPQRVDSPDIAEAEICKKNEFTGVIDYDLGILTPDDFIDLGICFVTEEQNDRPLIVYWKYEDQNNAFMKSEDYYFSPGELIFISMYDSAQIAENIFDMQAPLSYGNLAPGNYTAIVRHGRNNLATLSFEVSE